MATTADHELDNPVLRSLVGWHNDIAQRDGRAARFHPDVGPFMAVPHDAETDDWRALARLTRGASGLLFRPAADLPADWKVLHQIEGFQMVGPETRACTADDVGVLGPTDVPEMCALAKLTSPGPFSARTVETGTYLGIKEEGRLVAMAGERLHTDHWVEVSAVCTHPDRRGRGYATTLVAALTSRIRGRGKEPFMHVVGENTSALRLYEELGYEVRRRVQATEAVPLRES
ncbi:GNAT family N-acetyltransferase [Promicromonospora iranensis]|uniref:Ribosomal protein S18 acetylase RimI-like enzyme n=1 Tax=Promicromonospora iranensis TaxID=1105144 RepID=A0ABU2CM05_9MICO|nr:GNAT family N-acetyltransferase [Promicromonospora iranensis]MDR7382348.1 ribosomal protein S18 acetylase RimI-like enzyme [Promicromonospora iranensis]